jgi:hypothetical protein
MNKNEIILNAFYDELEKQAGLGQQIFKHIGGVMEDVEKAVLKKGKKFVKSNNLGNDYANWIKGRQDNLNKTRGKGQRLTGKGQTGAIIGGAALGGAMLGGKD